MSTTLPVELRIGEDVNCTSISPFDHWTCKPSCRIEIAFRHEFEAADGAVARQLTARAICSERNSTVFVSGLLWSPYAADGRTGSDGRPCEVA
jgi:hypothetical protein